MLLEIARGVLLWKSPWEAAIRRTRGVLLEIVEGVLFERPRGVLLEFSEGGAIGNLKPQRKNGGASI